MGERPDYEKAIALESAPSRAMRVATVATAGPLLMTNTAYAQVSATTGTVARLLALRVNCPKALASTPTSGALTLTVNLGSVNLAVACFGFAQWRHDTASVIGINWSLPMAGPWVIPLTSSYAAPSVYCWPAQADWPKVLFGVEFSGGSVLNVALYNGTNRDSAVEFFTVYALLSEEAIT